MNAVPAALQQAPGIAQTFAEETRNPSGRPDAQGNYGGGKRGSPAVVTPANTTTGLNLIRPATKGPTPGRSNCSTPEHVFDAHTHQIWTKNVPEICPVPAKTC